MKTACVFLLIVALAGCATTPHAPLTVHQRIEAACIGGGTAYGVITAVNNLHPLSASQQAQASSAKAKLDKKCKLAPGQDYPYSLSDALLTELEGAAGMLNTIKSEVQP